MKKIISILLVVFGLLMAVLPVRAQQRFAVIQDTIRINAIDYFDPISTIRLKWSAPYHDWYFCAFKEIDVFEFWKNQNIILAISRDGKTIKPVFCPPDFKRNSYGDLYVWHDTLFLHTYYSFHTPLGYYFDEKQWDWMPAEHISDIFYEDNLYQVAFVDEGEWGEYTWFIERQGKRTGIWQNERKQFLRPERLSRILKVDSTYYFIHSNRVDTIGINSAKGTLCDYSMEYEMDINVDYKYLDRMFHSTYEGFKVPPPFPTYYSFSGRREKSNDFWAKDGYETVYDTIIKQAFRWDGQIYYIVKNPEKTVIAELQNGRMRTVLDLDLHADYIRWVGTFRGINPADNRCFLQFKKDFYTYGMMEVEDSTVHICYLTHNQDTLPIVGTDNIQPLLEFLLKHLDNLSFSELNLFESQLGGTCGNLFTPFENGYFPDKYNKSKDYFKAKYYKIVDNVQTLITSYCVTEQDSIVKGVYLEWVKTNFFNSDHFQGGSCENVETKCAEVAGIVTSLTGTQPKKEKNCLKWTYNGLTVELHDYGRMVIY